LWIYYLKPGEKNARGKDISSYIRARNGCKTTSAEAMLTERLRQIIARHFDAVGSAGLTCLMKITPMSVGTEHDSSPPYVVEVMTSSPLPHHLAIHNTNAIDGSQTFAGINLGTINYAPSETTSSEQFGIQTVMITE
jgi:hypothetical protein